MQLPDFFLPNKPGQNNSSFGKPGPSLYYVVIHPIALLEPQTIAVSNVGIADSKVDKGGNAKKGYRRNNNVQNSLR